MLWKPFLFPKIFIYHRAANSVDGSHKHNPEKDKNFKFYIKKSFPKKGYNYNISVPKREYQVFVQAVSGGVGRI